MICPKKCKCRFERIAQVWKGWNEWKRKMRLYKEDVSTFRIPDGIRPRAGAFIHDKDTNKILVIQTDGYFFGPPKGAIELELNETYKDAAIREIKEETGLELNEDQLEDLVIIDKKEYYFYVELSSVENPVTLKKIAKDGDSTGVGWITPECLRTFFSSYGIMTKHLNALIEKFYTKIVEI